MIRKLRNKFILISMLSVSAVLFLIIGVSAAASYRNVVQEADRVLMMLAENGGDFPDSAPEEPAGGNPPDGAHAPDGTNPPPGGNPPGEGSALPPAGGESDGESGRESGEEAGAESGRVPAARGTGGAWEDSPELPFEARFFSVELTEAGVFGSADVENIAAVDVDTAFSYAAEIMESGRTHGFVGNYRYVVQELAGGIRVIFLDCARSLSNFHDFCLTSVSVSFFGLAAVFVLIVIFSRWVVRPAAESYEKQRRFITDAGHELKTPLAIINADADVLAMDVGENEWVADIKSQTERLSGLVGDLISLARMEEIRETLTRTPVSLSELAEESVHGFQAAAVSKERTFTAQIAPDVTVLGDGKMLARLFSILLDNAFKYCPEGGNIALKLENTGKAARLAVTNTAEHVDPKELSRLFDRFYRPDQSRNSGTGGHGIGLSIADSIVAAHKGKITASAKDGKGITFTVTLPLH